MSAATEFRLDQISPGAKEARWLDVCPLDDGTMLQLPLLVARGKNAGPTMVALGGVHGDEYEGVDAVRRVFESLDPAEMSGSFLGVPVCNPPAFLKPDSLAARKPNDPFRFR